MGCGNKISDTCGGKKNTATCVKYEGIIGEHSELIQCDCHTVEEIIEDLYEETDKLFGAIDVTNFTGDECVVYPTEPTLIQVLETHDSTLKAIAEKIGLCDPDCPDCPSTDDDCTTSDCCPSEITITLTKAQINNLHTTSIPLLVPPSGFGIKIVKPPILKVYSDNTLFIFASGETLNIRNTATVLPLLSQFSDPCITLDGVYSGSFFHTYQSVINSALSASASAPISAGGANSKMTITLFYELTTY